MKDYIVESNHTLEEYKKRYKRHPLIKCTDKDVVDFDKKHNTQGKYLLRNHRWWYIDGVYYEAPKSKFLHRIKLTNIYVKIGVSALLVGLISGVTYHAVKVSLPTYSVTFVGDPKDTHLVMKGNNIAKRNEDYKLTFNIDYMYELNYDNIHVYINNREKNNSWTFRYQTNVKNEFVIKKEFIRGDINIVAKANYKTTPSHLFGIENDSYVEKQLNVEVYTGDEEKKVEKEPIPQLHGTYAYPIHEDDCLKVIFTPKDGTSKIDENLWFRTNARYAKEKSQGGDYDFVKIVEDDGKKVTFIVPHFIIRDNCDLRVRP